ncbi:trihelix transcription factor GT-3b-like [Aristolochia californica]|uniref:trihelix transcription factor GT-3b-like n=1 Tax=Aristolochia californica TaxID=171875 RepID=UPI0035DAF20C
METHLLNPHPDLSDRFPQWSQNETREFIAIRAELDRTFMETKRNRLLWDLISNRMREKGFHRSAEQCKCKWKNLVTRYKGSETMDPEAIRQFPFQEELRAIFAARMQRLLWQQESDSAAAGSSGVKKTVKSDEEEEESMDECDADKGGKKKRKLGPTGRGDNRNTSSSTGTSSNAYEMLEEFLKNQLRIEMQWCKDEEVREEERRAKEKEWRQNMETLERERILMDRRWREKEEQRRAREEARAERRDQLITALLNKLIHESI